MIQNVPAYREKSNIVSESSKKRFFELLELYRAGRLAEAQTGLKKILAASPKDPSFLHLAAQVAERKGETDEALSLYRRAIAAHAGWLEATFNLARLLSLQKSDEAKREAVALLEELASKNPERAEIWEGLARTAQMAGDWAKAVRAWRETVTRRPDYEAARGPYAFACRAICDWSDPPAPSAALAPHFAVVLFDDPALQKQSAQLYCARHFSALKTLPRPLPWTHERPRIGYLSSDFHAHATSYLIAELFELHDREKFEIFAYSYGVDDGSAIRARLRKEAEHFTELNDFTPLECAQKIRADEIDLLIDLKGHTAGARLDILAHRPAPRQAHWLGFPGTTGASFIDFFFADAATVPVGGEEHFAEKIVRLPFTYQINDRKKRAAAPKARETYGLPENAFVFASFNQTYKITPDMFDLWCELLQEVPGSVLWLYESNDAAPGNLRAEAEKRGVDPARLIFAPAAPQEEHLARYAAADLALDTFPVGGHTTTSDALWMGVPVVAIEGNSFVSRVSTSLLRAAELPLLVANAPEAYKKRVLDLARNKAALDSIRRHLKDKRDTLPLFDTPRFVRDFEKVLLSCLASSETSSS